MPFEIKCQRCGGCCRWPGEIRLSEAEIARIAARQGLSEREFIDRHTRLCADRRGLALKEPPDGSCIFFSDSGCTIQTAKPRQCEEFPSPWVNWLWGRVPLEQIKQEYPMLFACPAFQEFLKQQSGPAPEGMR